jgi:methionyl-tRNA synthetase
MTNSKFQVFYFSESERKTYNVSYYPLDFGGASIHGMICHIDPAASSYIHNHFEIEFFLFLSGSGIVHVDGKKVDVVGGMGIQIYSFANHVIENTSTTEPLRFVSLYWDEKPATKVISTIKDESLTTLIFSTPPTPNGDLHLGHLAGPYLAADIYCRYLKYSSMKAFHATGRDDHQTYVITKAELKEVSPKMVADDFSMQIRETLQKCGISIDYFIEPDNNGEYGSFIKRIFKELYDAGYIIAKTEPATFSSDGKHYLHEAYIRGNCPYCNHESDGNACEECGRPNSCVDLHDAHERKTGQPPITRPCERLYFRWGAFTKQLDNYIKSTPMSAHAMALSQTMINNSLADICVSHPNDWGVQVPIVGFEKQKIYVWFEMAAGYLWAAMQLAPRELNENERARWFYNREDTGVVHFYGFDNTFYHTLLFPAVYFALGFSKPPYAHVINELLDLEGSKFSTSRGHLIWGRDLAQRVPVDYMRWFLCEVRPEGSRADFTLSHFITSINQMFFVTTKEWVSLLSAQITSQFNGVVPEPGAWFPEQRQFYNKILSCRQELLSCYAIEGFSPQTIVRSLRVLAETGLHFLQAQITLADAAGVRDYLRTSIALSILAIKIFSLLIRPITPDLGGSLLRFLAIPKNVCITEADFLPSGTICDTTSLPNFICLSEADITGILKRG